VGWADDVQVVEFGGAVAGAREVGVIVVICFAFDAGVLLDV
jgi:hypothetical protein